MSIFSKLNKTEKLKIRTLDKAVDIVLAHHPKGGHKDEVIDLSYAACLNKSGAES